MNPKINKILINESNANSNNVRDWIASNKISLREKIILIDEWQKENKKKKSKQK